MNIGKNDISRNNPLFIYVCKNSLCFYVVISLSPFTLVLFGTIDLTLYINSYFDTKCNEL